MELKKIIGKNITNLRKSRKLTQLELANELNYSDKAISKWENGDSLPDIETLQNVAKYFDVTLDFLVSEDHEDENGKFILPKHNLGNKLIITLLSLLALWIIIIMIYIYSVSFQKDYTQWRLFVYAVPLSSIVLLVFNCIWGRKIYTFIILSVLLWSLLTCIYIYFLSYNFWLIYITGIPIQIAIILTSQLRKSPKPKRKSLL